MTKKTMLFGFILASMTIASCESNQQEESTATSEETATTSPKDELPGITVSEIDEIRANTEALEIEPIEITTAEMRAKIKQKWSKVHFYVYNGKVVKIKTYPHSGISKRTEEFYAKDNALVLAVIEDDGSGPKGKSKDLLDKMYYYDNGKLIEERKSEKETEQTVKDSDAEEMLSEFKEYMSFYNSEK